MERTPARGRIVVGTDGSPASMRALEWAVREADIRTFSLDIVHAWRGPASQLTDTVLDPAPYQHEARAVLDRAVTSLTGGAGHGLEVRPILIDGDAATALSDVAEGADLLVVGSRGRGGFSALLLGSVSRRCAEQAPCPVAVVPPAWECPARGRIVVGVDGSMRSSEALEWALTVAVERDARLDVVNAYEYHAISWPLGPSDTTDRDRLEKMSQALMDDMVDRAVGRHGLQPSMELIPYPTGAARALLEVADGADLLVVGSRGGGGFRSLLLGSVSQQCIYHAPCPVVVVRQRAHVDRL